MSIVHHLPELPTDNSIVYADNGEFSPDRAIYKDGSFFGGGEFPVPQYKMNYVTKWFYLDVYSDHIKSDQNGNKCYTISFDQAENMSC